MKAGKVTMRDIAKKLNLSPATVSYVLNHSEKEKISHDTRIKVLETAKQMGYVPLQAAKALSKNKSKPIGIIVNFSFSTSSCLKQQALDLASELQKQSYANGYDALLSIVYDMEDIGYKYRQPLEAVFIIDFHEKYLKNIAENYYVPLIFLDCDFDDNMFYKILPDYDALIQEAKRILGDEHPYLVMGQLLNERMTGQITMHFQKEDIFIYKNNYDLKEFLTGKTTRKGIVIGDLLAVQVERFLDNSNIAVLSGNSAQDLLLPDTKLITVSNKQKAKVCLNVLTQLIHFECDASSQTRILLLPDSVKYPNL
jgi:DNA-binding Lrp family transcriptional regulator